MPPRPLALALVLAAACASRGESRRAQERVVDEGTWTVTRHRDHPLVGKIWERRTASFVDEAVLAATVAGADFVLLGEVHDNADHHRLQARLVRAATAAGRRPALLFEMLTVDQQATVDEALARSPRDPDALGAAVGWDTSGWPPFAIYRPVLAAGLEASLPIRAANLPRATVKALVSSGPEALDAPLRERLARGGLPAEHLDALRVEMREAHCGFLPEKLVDPLVLAQRARDATMSARLAEAGAGRGAILVAGNEHVRTDRGVPAYLAEDAPGREVVAIGLVEVIPGVTDPRGYVDEGSRPQPFDYAVFTPGAEREDPCEGLRERMPGARPDVKAARDAPAAQQARSRGAGSLVPL